MEMLVSDEDSPLDSFEKEDVRFLRWDGSNFPFVINVNSCAVGNKKNFHYQKYAGASNTLKSY